MILESKRIRLVNFVDECITEKYVSWLNDPEVNRYLYIGRERVDIAKVKNLNDEKTKFFAVFTNCEVRDGKVFVGDVFDNYIGTCSINKIERINNNCHCGYMIGSKKHWGLGLATEVVGLITDYALDELNFRKISAGVVDGNVGSVRVLNKNGYTKYATIPEEFFLDGEYRDVHMFYKRGK